VRMPGAFAYFVLPKNRLLQSVTVRGSLSMGWRVSVLTALTSGDVPAHFLLVGSPTELCAFPLHSVYGPLWGFPPTS
jgi:hypothetical protein